MATELEQAQASRAEAEELFGTNPSGAAAISRDWSAANERCKTLQREREIEEARERWARENR